MVTNRMKPYILESLPSTPPKDSSNICNHIYQTQCLQRQRGGYVLQYFLE